MSSACDSRRRLRRSRREWPGWRRRAPWLSLLRAVSAVAGVAEAGDDVAVVVELLVHRGGPDMDVRVGGAQRFGAGAGGEPSDEAHVGDADLLQPVDRSDRGMAGGDHRIDAGG